MKGKTGVLLAVAILMAVLGSLFLIVTLPSVSADCNEREYNECFACDTSRTVRQNSDCSYTIIVPSQYDSACHDWCAPPPPPPTPCNEREYNECFACDRSRLVRQNSDCSYTILDPDQYDPGCNDWCAPPPPKTCDGFEVPREYNECFDCFKSKRVRQNEDCTYSTIVSEQFDSACGGSWCPAPPPPPPSGQLTISGRAFCENGNGGSVGGATVKLLNDRGNIVKTTTTNGNGVWSITDTFNSAIGGDHNYAVRSDSVNSKSPKNTYEMLKVNSNVVQMTVWPFTSFSRSGLDLKYNCPSVPPPPGNNKPEGFLDSADCNSFNGWSRDPDTTTSIDVHFYADGPAGTGTFVGSVKANSFRSDLCNLWGNGNADCLHGFSFATPSSLKNGVNHAIYVHGIDSSGGENPLLSSVPRTINCPSGPVNNPPVLNPIGNKVINEGQLLQFTISGSDPDNDVLTFSASNLPSGASFNPASRIFSWIPNFQQAGVYQVAFSVSDGHLSDSEVITITVLNVNQPPDLLNPGNKQINEGQLLQFQLQASDPDGDALTFSSANLPSGATLSSSGLFSWVPGFNQAGSYVVTFSVTDGSASDSETIVINVHNVNRPPVLDPISDKVVFEGQLLQFTVNGSDPDGDNIAFSASNLPSGASFNPASRTFSWTPGFGQAGEYNVTFSVSDGFLSDSKSAKITVVNVNRPPVLDPVGNKVVNEGALLQFIISGSDPDGDAVAFSAANLPSGASFNPVNRTFSWTPAFNQAGLYNVTFSITDGLLSDTETITITVTDTNRAPSLVSGNVSPSSGTIFTTFTYRANYSDPDNDAPVFVGLFVDGDFFDDMTQENPSDTNYVDGATFFITVTGEELGKSMHSFFFDASDGKDVVISENFTGPNVVNLGPALEPVSNKFVNEGELVEFLVKASDPDDTTLTLSMLAPPQVNASFTSVNDTTAKFSWSPGFDAAGSYVVGFTASDGFDSDAINVTITVGNVNRAPIIITTPLTEVVEPDLESFSAVYNYDADAIDPDGDNVTFSMPVFPEGATIDPSTGFITWKPNKNQLGANFFKIIASDGFLTDEQSWTVIVKLPPRIGIPRRELFVEHVIVPECMEPGSKDILFVSIENIGLHPLEDFTVTALAFDNEYRKKIGPFDVDVGKEVSRTVYFDVPPDAPSGKYDLRITMSNDFVRRVKHREFEVREKCPCEACLRD